MTTYQWASLGLVALGFLGTWIFGAFKLGRAVEQMRSGVREEIAEEKEKIIAKLGELDDKFSSDQRTQDDRFGEVGAAMRQYIADVEKKVREVEIWGRDHYVQKSDLKVIVDQIRSDFKEAVGEIKEDIRQLLGKH